MDLQSACVRLFPTFRVTTRFAHKSTTREGKPIDVGPAISWRAWGWLDGTLQQWCASAEGEGEELRERLLRDAHNQLRELKRRGVRPATKLDLYQETP